MATKKTVTTKKTTIATVANAVAKAAVPARAAKAVKTDKAPAPKTVAAMLRDDLAKSEALRQDAEAKNATLLDAHAAAESKLTDANARIKVLESQLADRKAKDDAAYETANENSRLTARITEMEAGESLLRQRAIAGDAAVQATDGLKSEMALLRSALRVSEDKASRLSQRCDLLEANAKTADAANGNLRNQLARVPGWVRNFFGVTAKV